MPFLLLSFSPTILASRAFACTPNPLLFNSHLIMSLAWKPVSRPDDRRPARCHTVPGLSAEEVAAASEEAFGSYYTPDLKRKGTGVAIMWFRNDLRVLDNESLIRAWAASDAVLPVYCVDPRHYGTTHYFGFPKTGAFRAQFLIESLADLKKNLMKHGLDLLVRHGKPEDILPSVAKALGAHTVYAQKESCSEELLVEELVRRGLHQVVIHEGESSKQKSVNPKLQLIWGSTMYHIDDLPFEAKNLPDVYTQFRKAVESKCSIRSCFKLPASLGPLPSGSLDEISGQGTIPTLEQLGYNEKKFERGMHFVGGENAALGRVHEYFWENDMLRVYKETRNGMLGPDYSTKFSPWLASGSLSPRYIYEEVKRYEKQRLANDSTYWVLFELIWRDYFRFLSIKNGNSIFHLGPRKVMSKWSQDQSLFESWRDGRTGYPLIDANMKELCTTGFMSNRGRQAKTYDPEGEYVAYWLPELRALPKDRRNFPGQSYIKQVVPLKFENTNQRNDYAKRGKGKWNNVHEG
uniref:Cryptochrome DASH n=1 Tax=Elaeis guineensis var. tenera TaxID=51953 RepID=A0A6I9RV39_ELAGV|nr:cryptochrome DASH, chloroplastic/mitochondrial isoform X4 [Elaeis guineensis]